MNNNKIKVGIVTMRGENYGNRLQNYALQTILIELGYDVETLQNPWLVEYNPIKVKIKNMIKLLLFFWNKEKRTEMIRLHNFADFDRKYIKESKFWLNKNKDTVKAADKYDIFVCGSDQVWTLDVNEIQGRWYADFAEKKKRKSYAASFGIDYIPKTNIEIVKKYLEGMDKISVREKSGVSIINKISNRKALQHVDPVFLIKKEEWKKFERKPKKRIPNDYILVYLLGGITKEIREQICLIKNYFKIQDVIYISNINYLEYYTIDPCEFLYLVNNSRYILTDSFHATSFACIFNILFSVTYRNNSNDAMVTRIQSILDILGLKNRLYKQLNPKLLTEEIKWDEVNLIISNEAKKGIQYLAKLND